MTRKVLFPVLLAFLCSAAACGVPEAMDGDEVDELSQAITGLPTSTFYSARHDNRKCMFPLCGGFWVKRVNRPMTTCADGSSKTECYVATIELASLGLGATLEGEVRDAIAGEMTLLRGKLSTVKLNGAKVPRFVASEAWMAAAPGVPAASDIFYRGSDSGIRCMRAPCPVIATAKLNYTTVRKVDGVDFGKMPGTDADRDEAMDALMSPTTLLVAGQIVKTKSQGNILFASQAYRKASASGQLCGPADPACGPGLKCCYPCGIQGCHNICMAVPGGMCPAIP